MMFISQHSERNSSSYKRTCALIWLVSETSRTLTLENVQKFLQGFQAQFRVSVPDITNNRKHSLHTQPDHDRHFLPCIFLGSLFLLLCVIDLTSTITCQTGIIRLTELRLEHQVTDVGKDSIS